MAKNQRNYPLIRYQLLEDMFGEPDYRLTKEQKAVIQAITRPQLQEDMFLAMTGRDRVIFYRTGSKNEMRIKNNQRD